MNAKPNRYLSKQRGAAAVELAIVFSLLLILMFGILEFGRVFYYMNATAETTRWGARCAVVSNKNDGIITAGMIKKLPLLSSPECSINIEYLPESCSDSNCRTITVSTQGCEIETFIPGLPFTPIIPPFSTTLPRESMNSITDSTHPNCVVNL